MLVVAPPLYHVLLRFHGYWAFTQKIITITVTSLVVLHLLPESIRMVGLPAVGLAFIGLFLPSLLERLWTAGAKRVHLFSLLLALLGLVVHGMMDGAALAASPVRAGQQELNLLQLAVLLHRLPAAILVWSLFYQRRGPGFPAAVLSLLGLATIVGFAWGRLAFQNLTNFAALFSFQALVAGSLLHIAFDRHEEGDAHAHAHAHGDAHEPHQHHS